MTNLEGLLDKKALFRVFNGSPEGEKDVPL